MSNYENSFKKDQSSNKNVLIPETNISNVQNIEKMNLLIEKLKSQELIKKELNYKKIEITLKDCEQLVFNQLQTDISDFDLNKIQRIGHRGCGKNTEYNLFPRENTIESFNLAYVKKAQMVELDVHMTNDEVLVVFHDSEINGIPIYKMTLEEFLFYTKSDLSNKTTNTTLENVLKSIPDCLGVYVEIKYDLIGQNNYFEYGNKLVISVINLLSKFSKKNIVIASFSPLICALVRFYSSYKICFIIDVDIYFFLNKDELQFVLNDYFKYFSISAIVFDSDFYSDIESFLKINPLVTKIIYGEMANKSSEVKKMQKLGVTGFCTDDLSVFEDFN